MKQKPNIILIITDQQRFDALSCHGNPHCPTPNLDALAARSVDFTNAHCPTPLCSPARATLMTGRSVPSHRLYDNCHTSGVPLRPEERTFSESLAESGYSCALSGKWHLGNERTAQRGFSRWVNHRQGWREHLEAKGLDYAWAAGGLKRFGPGVGENPPLQGLSVLPEDDLMAASVTRHARRMLGEVQGEQPFLLKYAMFEPHPPIEAPEPWYSLIDPDALETPANARDDMAGKPAFHRAMEARLDAAHLDEAGWRKMRAVYFGSVAMLDHQIGLFLYDLKARGLFEDSLILFTSDHGCFLGEHGLYAKGPSFYEETMAVPLLIHFPGQTAGEKYDGLVALEDVAPTLLEAAGLPIPESMEGLSLRQMLRGETPARDAVHGAWFGDLSRVEAGRMVRTIRWKYIWHPLDLDELYDLQADPGELCNRAEDPSASAALTEMRGRLRAWMDEIADPLRAAWNRP